MAVRAIVSLTCLSGRTKFRPIKYGIKTSGFSVDISKKKEEFSRAYVRAVSAVAGFGITPPPDPDDDSVDFMLCQKGGNGTIRSPRVEVQIKCTARDLWNGDALHYPLSIKNYGRPTSLFREYSSFIAFQTTSANGCATLSRTCFCGSAATGLRCMVSLKERR